MDARTPSNINMLRHCGADDGLIDLAALVASRPDSALAALLAAADVVLVLAADGCIDQVHAGSGEVAAADVAGWLGRAFNDTMPVPIDLGDPAGAAPRWREAMHITPAGELPLKWLALPLAGGRQLAIARDLRASASLQHRLARAQQALERDTQRMRQMEQRQRLLFDTAGEPIFVLDAASRRILEANAAAAAATGRPAAALVGSGFAPLLHAGDHDGAVALLGALAATPQRQPLPVRLAGGGRFAMAVNLFRQDHAARVMVRLTALEPVAAGADMGIDRGVDRAVETAIERLPDPLVITDDGFIILAGNGAFLDLVGLARPGDIEGQPLARFLGRPGADLAPLVAALRENGMVVGHITVADGQAVEVSALSSGDGAERRHGFAIRRTRPADGARSDAPAAVPLAQLTAMVGRLSLKDIVRDATDVIERLCIEAALAQADDNRASAAGLLGLSRQSLYTKLHRHGIGRLGDGTGGEANG